VYCPANAELRDGQILLRDRGAYLCAPQGQFLEGYLAIAPYRCRGSLARLPARDFPAVVRLQRIAADFCRATYRAPQVTFYEQGRADADAGAPDETFPLHAHLCCLPLALDLHSVLEREYARADLSGVRDLPVAAGGAPYVYVEGPDARGEHRRSLYVGRSMGARASLRRMRLKPMIAELLGMPERGNWRAYPGDRELQQVIASFGRYRKECRPRLPRG
jgi:hypothetical protein